MFSLSIISIYFHAEKVTVKAMTISECNVYIKFIIYLKIYISIINLFVLNLLLRVMLFYYLPVFWNFLIKLKLKFAVKIKYKLKWFLWIYRKLLSLFVTFLTGTIYWINETRGCQTKFTVFLWFYRCSGRHFYKRVYFQKVFLWARIS